MHAAYILYGMSHHNDNYLNLITFDRRDDCIFGTSNGFWTVKNMFERTPVSQSRGKVRDRICWDSNTSTYFHLY